MSLPLPPLLPPRSTSGPPRPGQRLASEASPASRRFTGLTPAMVLVICLLLTAASTALFSLTTRAGDLTRFENITRTVQERISSHLNADEALLRGTAGLFSASEQVTHEEFSIYVERLDLKRYGPGIREIGFSQRIPAEQKDATVASLRGLGFSTFRLMPDTPREEYHAITYLEPAALRPPEAMGFDMFTEPVRRAAMERAWQTGAPALSGKVTLGQETEASGQEGFVMYVPVYQGHALPETEQKRWQLLEGFVYTPFSANALFSGLFTPLLQTRVTFRLYDGQEPVPEALLYDSGATLEKTHARPVFTSASQFEVAGHPWTLAFTSQPDFDHSLMATWAPGVGGIGTLMSLLVFAFARSQQNARKRAEDNEAERAWLLARERLARAETEAQRTHLQDIFMQAPAIIAILGGPRQVFEFANTACQEVLGHRELLGKPLHEAVPDLKQHGPALIEKAYRTGRPLSGREVCLPLRYTLGGRIEERYWDFFFQPRRTPDGAVDGMMVFAFEVTDQLQARQEVELSREEARRSAAQLQAITDTLPALVAYLDLAERYRFANQAYESWFGVKPEDVLGKTAAEFVGAEAYEGVRHQLRQALSGEIVRYEVELKVRGGRKIYMQSNYLPDRDAQGHVRGIVVLAHDLTERKKEEEIVRNAVRLRDEFLSVASHELKTPLTPLSLKLQALARAVENEPETPFTVKVRAHVEAGRKQLNRLSVLIGDLLDVSRISSGQMRLRWEPVDFAALVRDVVTRLEPEALRAESPLSVEAPGSLAGSTDRLRFEQVVENLLTNAIKYGAGKPIHIVLKEEAGAVVLRVEDHGIGIELEHQERIFERFERAVSERNYGGLGLGLYITRTIVELLGGTIRVQSQPGQGAAFTVDLPREPPSGTPSTG
ncbi:CHASE domain-containing protein [Stigmatella sp. ncwal1]|uniref:histidine kinase n=1 Tax=Stigmatella ashevillensis TaxID=2995309 RepID=A0ABT5DC42_9BACT|nr:CHASE domain-containing protein [Stigmatella ashevillena]MDC0711096.1 CHASE domain-containing protein [Stigmatella ashevillena]